MTKKIRYDINGLKAIAIIFIVLYHFFDLLNASSLTSVSFFSTGFLGVDIFLVISGFLIAASIFKKLDNDSFKITSFYKRRLLRILPPLIIVSLTTLVVGYFLLFPDIYKELAVEILNTFVFTGNFRFANSGGYFSLESSDKLFLHSWYICITLQFYLIYPIIIIALKKIFKEKIAESLAVITIALIIVAVICGKKGNGYLLTQCRIWEMFLGGVVYLYSEKIKLLLKITEKNQAIFEGIGLLMVLVPMLLVNQNNGTWYISTSLCTVMGTIIILITNSSKSVLKNVIFDTVGKTSYSTYLWHWPIIVFALRLGFTIDTLDYAVLCALLICVTSLSYIYLEKKEFSNKLVILLYLTITIFCLFVKTNNGIDVYMSNFMIGNHNTQNALKINEKTDVKIKNHVLSKFSNSQDKPHIFMIGDSHAGHYEHYLLTHKHAPILFYSSAATMAYGEIFSNFKNVQFGITETTRKDFYSLYKDVLGELESGDKVLLSNNWYVYYQLYLEEKNLKHNLESIKLYLKDLVTDISEQAQKHKNIDFYIIGQGFYTTKNKVVCTTADLSTSFLSNIIDQELCKVTGDYLGNDGKEINSAFKQLADSEKNIHFIDRNIPLRIQNNYYKTVENKIPLFSDNHHYSGYGGTIVGNYIMDQINKKQK